MSRVLIGVMSCLVKPSSVIPMPERTMIDHTKRWQAIRDTWGKDADYRIFYGAGKIDATQADEVQLNCGDSYYETAYKVQAMCRWALDQGYDGLFKADDDTYLVPDRIRFGNDFVCRVLPSTDENHPLPYAYGGCGYYVGKKLMELAAEDKYPTSKPEGTTMDRCNTYEDGWIARVAMEHGIRLTDDHRLKALRHGGDFEGHPWQAESPTRNNDCISVCEFPEDYMYAAHKHFLES